MSALLPTAISTPESAKFAPLVGALLGALGGAVYWLAAQLWPTNVAVILSMTLTALLASKISGASVFYVLIKYNALMALSAAQLPFAVPPNVALGLIMICGHAASFALVVPVMAARPEQPRIKASVGSSSLALLIGFAPAGLLGIPGLSGLAAAVAASIGFVAYLKLKSAAASSGALGLCQMASEACFYLGALAAWSYI